MQRTTLVFAVALFGVLAPPAFAGDRGSMEDQLACTPDVYRLCSSLIPDEDAITACLQKNLAQLSPGCHKVFAPTPGQASGSDDSE